MPHAPQVHGKTGGRTYEARAQGLVIFVLPLEGPVCGYWVGIGFEVGGAGCGGEGAAGEEGCRGYALEETQRGEGRRHCCEVKLSPFCLKFKSTEWWFQLGVWALFCD